MKIQNHRRIFAAALFALSLLSLPVQAQLAAGRDYRAIEPALPTENPSKIEVVEFFNYGCPHCADLHPSLSKWTAKLPKDVSLRRVAVGFGDPQYTIFARLYFALEVTNNLSKLDDGVFHAIHSKGLKLTSEEAVLDWVGLQGGDVPAIGAAYRSFGVVNKVNQGNQLAKSARIKGVPALMVDGRYLMLNDNIKSHDELLANTSKVIDLVRRERGLKK